MKHGDFTELAKFYMDRPGYSLELLKMIRNHILKEQGVEEVCSADVGAGTGKLTENLAQIGVKGYAVEPNDAMREEGIKLFADKDTFVWSKGSAEMTNLPDECVEWVLMGSSFHWVDAPKATEEFKRILKPGGFFTAIWNPRDIKRSAIQTEIEDMIYREVSNIKRISSGSTMTTEQMREKLSGGAFGDIIFMEASYEELMTKERYLNIWHSVNDIRVQAGEDGFQKIMENIEKMLKNYQEIIVPYKARAWTARVRK